jgi:GNAT superfamily N-acetyltransferase
MRSFGALMNYRLAEKSDISAMARIRSTDRETEEHWNTRISRYMDGQHHPQQALLPRVGYVAIKGESVVGFIAGHLTRRYGCDGELQWVAVIPEHRRTGVASELFRRLADWFVALKTHRVCVNVEPDNAVARQFYARHGAEKLNEYWLIWNDIRQELGERRSS